MPARDTYHNAFRNALIKDGWTITNDPYRLAVGSVNAYIDLAAERVIAAERGAERIAVEIKSFVSASDLREVELAIGQYVLYRSHLRRSEPERKLYMAVPERIFLTTLDEPMSRFVLEDESIALIAFDPENEVITKWKS
jgi:hypothetical protein